MLRKENPECLGDSVYDVAQRHYFQISGAYGNYVRVPGKQGKQRPWGERPPEGERRPGQDAEYEGDAHGLMYAAGIARPQSWAMENRRSAQYPEAEQRIYEKYWLAGRTPRFPFRPDALS